jgi:hypothetical protein
MIILFRPRFTAAWVGGNIIGSFLFIHFASWTWLEPNLRGEDVGREGDALVWFLGAFPILFVVALANSAWLFLVWRGVQKKGFAWPLLSIILVALVWLCAMTVDHLRGLGF